MFGTLNERLEKIVRSIRGKAIISEADLDLKGKKGWPPELVVEVLVARLAAMR